MKFGITGHTAGLGQAIASLVPHCGFSRTNGYDITKQQDRARIIAESGDCNVFVNNAFSDHYQTVLLYELFDSWQDQSKIIINIGSNTTDGIKSMVHIYAAEKASLDKASEQLAYLYRRCKITLVRFGWIGTQRVLSEYNPPHYIDVMDAAKIVVGLATQENRITTLTILPEYR